MAYIEYTALRGLVLTGFNVTGTDISAAAVDDSFNSTSTDLSGLLDGQSMYVSGYVDPANNSWMEVAADSTVNKILQNTNALVDEAAGPTVQILGYERAPGVAYKFSFGLSSLVESVRTKRQQSVSLSGVTETILNRNENWWTLTTTGIHRDRVAQFWEFIKSVSAGETFFFDPYGTVDAPGRILPVLLESINVQARPLGGGLAKDYFTFNLQFREPPI